MLSSRVTEISYREVVLAEWAFRDVRWSPNNVIDGRAKRCVAPGRFDRARPLLSKLMHAYNPRCQEKIGDSA